MLAHALNSWHQRHGQTPLVGHGRGALNPWRHCASEFAWHRFAPYQAPTILRWDSRARSRIRTCWPTDYLPTPLPWPRQPVWALSEPGRENAEETVASRGWAKCKCNLVSWGWPIRFTNLSRIVCLVNFFIAPFFLECLFDVMIPRGVWHCLLELFWFLLNKLTHLMFYIFSHLYRFYCECFKKVGHVPKLSLKDKIWNTEISSQSMVWRLWNWLTRL